MTMVGNKYKVTGRDSFHSRDTMKSAGLWWLLSVVVVVVLLTQCPWSWCLSASDTDVSTTSASTTPEEKKVVQNQEENVCLWKDAEQGRRRREIKYINFMRPTLSKVREEEEQYSTMLI